MSAGAVLASVQPSTQRLVINPYVRVTYCGNNEVLVKHGSRSRFSQVIRDEGRTKLLGRVLRGLRRPGSLADLVKSEQVREAETADADRLVEYLVEQHILIPPDEYLPHVYFAMQYGGEGVDALRNRTVGMLGTGSLGSRIARELGRMQVKELVLLDARPAETHDRAYFDLPASAMQAGGPYAAMTQKALEADGYPAARIVEGALEDPKALTDVFDQCDFVVVALEWASPTVLHEANQVALAMGKPWMSVYVDGSEALIGPLYVPGETICYNEFEIQNEAAVSLHDDFLLHKETLVADTGSAHLVHPAFLSVISGWAATAALSFLCSGKTYVVGRCVRIDFERFAVDYQDILRLPRCPACAPQRPGYRHTFL
jgi:thiazole/oxazole-forming peptide maturase SagC family component